HLHPDRAGGGGAAPAGLASGIAGAGPGADRDGGADHLPVGRGLCGHLAAPAGAMGAGAMSGRQLPLELPHLPRLERADFLSADANAEALAWIDRFPEKPGTVLALHGPAGSGKTHLAHIWAARLGASWATGGELASFD